MRINVGMLPRQLCCLGLALLLLGTSSATSRAVAWHGYSAHVDAQPDPGRYVGLVAAGGANTLRDDFSWSAVEARQGRFDWLSTDAIVRQAARHRLHVLMVADTTPAWASGASTGRADWWWLPPRHPADYGAFAGRLARRYGRRGSFWRANPQVPRELPAGIELWNEENTFGSWGQTTPSPEIYTAMVRAAYRAIKAADPAMTVILGGMGGPGAYDDVTCTGASGAHNAAEWNAVNYLAAVYAYGGRGYFDAVGWHAYNFFSGASAPEMLAYNRCSAWSQLATTPASARSVMVAHGDAAKQIWITESGAPTCVRASTYVCVPESSQATLASLEMRRWHSYRWAGGYYWYDIRDDAGAGGNEAHFGAVEVDNHPKPVFESLRLAWGSRRR